MTNAHSRWTVMAMCILSIFRFVHAQDKLGDNGDGTRSVPIHLIDMLDEEGTKIHPDVTPQMPFSTKQTCIECHTYDIIKTGLHFNAADSGLNHGRPGQPWIVADALSATQIPVHFREWEGTYFPADLGITNFDFVARFGRHFPGGGPGEKSEDDPADASMRWQVSGNYEINCMACHDADPGHDQAEAADNVRKENYRWIAAASSQFAEVEGTAKSMPDFYDIYSGAAPSDTKAIPPRVRYPENIFNSKDKVLFNIVKEVPNERCYYCHSTKYIGGGKEERWEWDEDIHLKAGMKCVDCHRNSMDHKMVRGYEGEAEEMGVASLASFSCKGCHVPDKHSLIPEAGRMGAPVPAHKGIPTVHFEKMSCTTCHSGPWPTKGSYQVKSSVTHELGVHGAKKADDAVPRIVAPVFIKNDHGMLEPNKLLYPSFWAFVNGDSIKPLLPEVVKPYIFDIVILADSTVDSTNVDLVLAGQWPAFTEEDFVAILDTLNTIDSTKQVGYISNGNLYTLSGGKLVSKKHKSAEPYSWAFAHDVRPASQSLGIRGCADCHSLNSAFHFGNVNLASAIVPGQKVEKNSLSFQKLGVLYPRLFAFTFLVRPWLKIFLIFCGLVLVAVLIKYALKGIDGVLKSVSKKEW